LPGTLRIILDFYWLKIPASKGIKTLRKGLVGHHPIPHSSSSSLLGTEEALCRNKLSHLFSPFGVSVT